MKTNFLPRNRRRNSRRELIVVGIVLIVAIGAFSIFGNLLTGVFAPLWRSTLYTRTGLRNVVESLRSKDALMAENAALKDKLAADDELIVSLRALVSSRDELISKFGRIPAGSIPAGVLVHPPETPYDILIVDAGENVGVRQGSAVFTPEGMMIGLVSDVFSRTARVKLYSSAGERTDAVLERGQAAVTLVGRGGGAMSFTLPRDAAVVAGDRVLSPRLEAPLIGVVVDVEASPTDSFKTVLVRSPINPSDVGSILIEQ